MAMLLSLIALAVISSAQRDGELLRNAREEASAKAIAEAGVARAVLAMLDPRPDHVWRADGRRYEMAFAGRRLSVAIEDEVGKIDLNTAPQDLIVGMFRVSGVSQQRAEEAADRIADWRDGDDERRLHGAERREYQAAHLGYAPRNAPFETVDELRLVLGVEAEMFERLRPALTVFSGRQRVDPWTASLLALRAQELALGAAGSSASIADVIERRFGSKRAEEDATVDAVATSGELAGRAITVEARVPMPRRNMFHLHAVIRLTGDQRRPYWIHQWSYGIAAP